MYGLSSDDLHVYQVSSWTDREYTISVYSIICTYMCCEHSEVKTGQEYGKYGFIATHFAINVYIAVACFSNILQKLHISKLN